MKKILSIASILLIAISTTACINNLAVQDLNNKAMAYADKGDYTQAIERLKSSIDLDSTIFETHYNLAIVYTKAEQYPEAIEEFKKIVEMKPDMADIYSSYAVTLNNLAVDMNSGKYRINAEGKVLPYEEKSETASEEKYKPTAAEKSYIKDLYTTSIDSYNKYLELSPDAKDKAEIEQQIAQIQEYLDKE